MEKIFSIEDSLQLVSLMTSRIGATIAGHQHREESERKYP